MNKFIAIVCAIFSAAAVATFAQSTELEREFALGIAAHRKADYEAAVDHFRRATLLDASSANAYVELGNAYRDWFCEGCDYDSEAPAATND